VNVTVFAVLTSVISPSACDTVLVTVCSLTLKGVSVTVVFIMTSVDIAESSVVVETRLFMAFVVICIVVIA